MKIHPFSSALLFICALFNINNGIAQEINWLHVEDNPSYAVNLNVLSDGSFLMHAGSYNIDDKVVKVDVDGNVIWSKNICNCEESSIYSVENDTSLIHITKTGFLYQTDKEGDNPVLLDSIQKDTTYKYFTFSSDIERIGNDLFLLGRVSNDDEKKLLRTRINIDSLTIYNDYGDFLGFPRSVSIDENGNRAELYVAFDSLTTSSIYWLDSNNTLLDSLIRIDEKSFWDLHFDEDGSLYVVGSELWNYTTDTGFVGKISSDKELLWVKNIPEMMGDPYFTLNEISISENRILVGGSVSGNSIQDLFIGEINSNGELLWSKTHHILGESDGINKMRIDENNNRVVFVGTGGLTDVSGFWRAYIMNLEFPTIVSTEIVLADKQDESKINFYPNPVNQYICIETEFDQIEVVDMSGKMLMTKENNQKCVNLSHLKAGSYVLRVMANGAVIGQEIFIKQ